MGNTQTAEHGSNFRLGTAMLDGVATTIVEVANELYRHVDLVERTAESSLLQLMREGGWERHIDRIEVAVAAGPAAESIEPRLLSWQPPLSYPQKLICIGANYTDHIREMGLSVADRPSYPYSFAVPPTNTLIGTGSQVAVPSLGERLDWEAEVAIVIGRTSRNLSADEAPSHIAAFGVLNDLTARDWSGPNAPAVGIDWVMAKAHDGFKPMAPFITPSRFVPHPEALAVRSWVNGELKQNGTTADMWFSFAEIVAHLSRIMTLEPGDMIATGTPSGVGHGRKPPEYLVAGDVVAVEVEGLGRVESTLVPTHLNAAV